MKKALSMILVLTMVLALALPAMAEEIIKTWPDSTASKESTQDVTATYTKESHTVKEGDVLYFTITWTANATETALAYTGEQATYTWDGASMTYVPNKGVDDNYVEEGWYGSTGYTIEVKNRSNIALKVTNSASNKYKLKLTQSVNGTTAVDYAEKESVLGSAAEGVTIDGLKTTGTETSVKVSYTYAAPTDGATTPEAPTSGETLTVGQLKVVVSKPNA